MLTALFIQHDQGFHAHLVTLQHNNDVTIARQTNAVSGARAERAFRRARPREAERLRAAPSGRPARASRARHRVRGRNAAGQLNSTQFNTTQTKQKTKHI